MKTTVRVHGVWRRQGAMLACAALLVQGAGAQSVRSLVNGGNDLYKDQKFADAEVNYRKALEKEQALVQGHFNLGDALHKQGKFDEAVREYESALGKAEANDTKAYAHYNIGNSLMREQRYADAVKAYIDALKLNPEDEDAKYNLSYALEKLRQQQQQQQQNKNQKNSQKKDQQKDEKQKQDQQKKERDQQSKDRQDKQKQPQSAQQQKQMSRADAQRILDVLKNSEKDVQKRLRARQAVRAKTDKDW
ncbi:MAG: tetratricopeptide repeat protein [Bacteroidota bacterium]